MEMSQEWIAKQVAKCAVLEAKRKALHEKSNAKNDIVLFCIAKQIWKQNQDIIGENCVKDGNKKLSITIFDTRKKAA